MLKKAIYPGTFDPITFGHIDIIERASKLFDKLVVAVSKSQDKNPLFSHRQRILFVRKATKHLKNVEIDSFNTTLVEYSKMKKIKTIIRGLRAVSDFEYEFQMALMNKELAPDLETIFIMSKKEYSFISSKMIKQIANLKGNLSQFVPTFVINAIYKQKK